MPGREPGAENCLGARFPVRLRSGRTPPWAQMTWPSLWSHHAVGAGGGLQRSVLGRFVGTPPDRLHVRRPEGTPCGRPTQASGPRLFVLVMSRRTSFSVGPTQFGQSPEAAGGRSVQRLHCSGPGAPRSVAHQRSTCAAAATDTPGSSLSDRSPARLTVFRSGGLDVLEEVLDLGSPEAPVPADGPDGREPAGPSPAGHGLRVHAEHHRHLARGEKLMLSHRVLPYQSAFPPRCAVRHPD